MWSASKLLDTFCAICQRSRGKGRWGRCSSQCRDNQTQAYFRWGQDQRWGGRLVIRTDCVLWLRRRVLLGRERGSIWAEFWGVLAHLNMVGTQSRPPEDMQAMPGILSHVVEPTACYWNPPRCLGYDIASYPHIHFPPTVSPNPFISSLCTSSKWTPLVIKPFEWVSLSRGQHELSGHRGTRCGWKTEPVAWLVEVINDMA